MGLCKIIQQTCLAATAFLAAVSTSPTHATDFYWNGASGELFTDPSKWALSNGTPANGPGGASDTVNFDLNVLPENRYTVTNVTGQNSSLLVRNDSVQLDITNYVLSGGPGPFSSPGLVVGVANGDTADVILKGNGSSALTTSKDASIGQNGSIGTLTVDNLQWNSIFSGDLEIGNSGTLRIVNGSDVLTGGSSNIDGIVAVTGANSTWTNEFFIEVGYSGTGILNISDGGIVNSDDFFDSRIGFFPGATGMVTVTGIDINGMNSRWNTAGLIIGFGGTGTLSVTDLGRVSSTTLTIGSSSFGQAGTGTLNIASSGLVDVSSSTFVGNGGQGSINFDNGTLTTKTLLVNNFDQLTGTGIINTKGLVTNGDLSFDQSHGVQRPILLNSQPNQNVTINLDVNGTGDLGDGYSGQGTLTIAEGVTVSSASGYLGYLAGSNGAATVSGVGSSWTNNGGL